ncbi:hypothetical protein QUA06_27560, partial [Microcoleus sp. POL8_C6]
SDCLFDWISIHIKWVICSKYLGKWYYFLSFDNERVARQTFELLNSQVAINFYSAIVFWDEKRPIKSSILNCLNLARLVDWDFLTADAS